MMKVALLVTKPSSDICADPDTVPSGILAPPLPVSIVIGNVVESPLVNVIVFNDTDAVVNKEPVSVLLPPLFNACDAVIANEDVTVATPVTLLNVNCELPLTFNPSLNCTDVTGPAGSAVAVIPCIPLPSPTNDPLKDPLIEYDPVGNCPTLNFLDIKPISR